MPLSINWKTEIARKCRQTGKEVAGSPSFAAFKARSDVSWKLLLSQREVFGLRGGQYPLADVV